MKATILKKVPPSGTYIERSYQSPGRPEGNVSVLFESAEAEWLGIFGKGDFGCTTATFFKDNRSCLVIAEGECYVIEPNSGNLLYKPEPSTFKEVFHLEDIDIAFIWSDGVLLILSGKGPICESNWLDIDGIEVARCDAEEILFKLWDIGDAFECHLNLKTHQLTLGRAARGSETTARLG